ncbi:hypothetical protein FACS1894105_14590 [Clostridia bacterium]|nr:hypothetical protein FACS1894105_14590 [Clostridia bacterium]
MQNMGIVRGSKTQAVPLVVGKDTVYVHTNIELLPPDEFQSEIYRYNEIQYGKDEYITMMSEQNAENRELLNAILGVENDAE